MFDKTELRITHQQNTEPSIGLHTEINYKGMLSAASYLILAEKGKFKFKIEVAQDFEHNETVIYSLIRSTIAFLVRQTSETEGINIVIKASKFDSYLCELGFNKRIGDCEILIPADYALPVRSAWVKVTNEIQKKEKPLFAPDALLSDSEANALQIEYNEIAWGFTNWARNSEIQSDEVNFIKTQISSGKNLEIGVGSGRLTRLLIERSDKLVGIDREIGIVDALSKILVAANLNLVCTDFLKNNFEDSTFDNVLFLENGLGATLSRSARENIFNQAARVLKPNGRFLIGVRSFGDGSKNQVMPATQDNIFIGIYRTFSQGEIRDLSKESFLIEEIIQGDCRPAGGRQIFFALRRK